jgi:hypothetical protein
MKKILGIVVLGLLWCNTLPAKIINLSDDINLDVPDNFIYSELSQNMFEEIDGWEDFFGSNSEMFYIGTPNSVNFSKELIENPDKFLEPILKKLERKKLKSEKAIINFIGKEVKKLSKKKGYESVTFIIKGGTSITQLMNDNNDFKEFMLEVNEMSAQDLEKEMKAGKIDFIKDLNEGLGELKQFYKFSKIKLSKDSNNNPYLIFNYKASLPPLKTIGQWYLFIHNDRPYFMGIDCMGCTKLKEISLIKMTEPMLSSKKVNISANNDLAKQLKDLSELFKSGALTKEEFTKAKKKLLN